MSTNKPFSILGRRPFRFADYATNESEQPWDAPERVARRQEELERVQEMNAELRRRHKENPRGILLTVMYVPR